MTGLLYTHFHDNINFLNNPSYLKSEKPVCCINFLQQLTLYRLSLEVSVLWGERPANLANPPKIRFIKLNYDFVNCFVALKLFQYILLC